MAGKGASMENDQPRDDDRNEEVEESPAPDPEEGEPVLDDGPAEDLVLADLEDRKVAPGTILVGLREPKRDLADPPLDRLQSQRHPFAFWRFRSAVAREREYDSKTGR